MKKILSLVCLAALAVFALSCEKDPSQEGGSGSDNLSPDQEFWSVVGQLVSMNDITPDYKGKTFTPIIGTETEPGVRVVGVNSLQAAVERYNSLTGASIDTNTVSHTYSSKEVGKLTWSKNTDNKAWATVDVSISAVPTLQKIVYRSAEQGDVNGSVGEGYRAYYRFGDVVSRSNKDGKTEYWVCVRPAFHHEGKGKSHWVTVSPLPDSNIWPYYDTKAGFTASNGYVYGLPYNIRDDLEWVGDLAEMLFAICKPSEWFGNITSYSSENMFGSPKGLAIFNDFHSSKKGYHNQYFWENVQSAWVKNNLFRQVFGQSVNGASLDMSWFSARVAEGGTGLNFLYNGYSWWVKTSNTPQLWQVNYKSERDKNGTSLNMHKKTPTKPSHRVVNSNNLQDKVNNIEFNVKTECTLAQPYVVKPEFFGDNEPRWIIRYAEGQELSSDGEEDPLFALRGVTEVYRYYANYELDAHPTDPPEETKKEKDGYVGKAHYRWGNVYRDETNSLWYVMNMAGYDSGEDDLGPDINERSPYSELISITPGGMKLSQDTQYVDNLPTLDQAIRAIMWMHMAFNATRDMTDQNLQNDDTFGKTALNIKEYAGLDQRKIFQLLVPQDGHPRHHTHAFSVPYRIPGMMAQQPLLRCIINNQAVSGMPQFYFWTHYPQTPDNQTQKVTQFGVDLITLSDLGDQNMVNKYAKDAYAVCAVSTMTDPSSNESVPRAIRSSTDPDSRNIPLYYYEMQKWNNLTYKTDMWNAPIFFFRYTRVKDRGDLSFSPQTVDGHTLTLEHARPWTGGNFSNEDEAYRIISSCQASIWDNMANVFVDGQAYHVKRWNEFPVN